MTVDLDVSLSDESELLVSSSARSQVRKQAERWRTTARVTSGNDLHLVLNSVVLSSAKPGSDQGSNDASGGSSRADISAVQC